MSEMTAPTSEWKIVFGLVLVFFTISCWVYMFMRNNVFDAMLPSTITKEHHQAQVSAMSQVCVNPDPMRTLNVFLLDVRRKNAAEISSLQ